MKVKGGVCREQTQCRRGDFFHGSDRWCYHASTLMETSNHEVQWLRESTEGSTHEGSTKKQPCLSHNGHHPQRTCLTRVDLHEVGDLLARTNSLVQLHNLVEGSQVTPNQSRRHHSPRGNRWCVDDELLALVLQMIVSPTLNSLSQIWIWWKEDLSGKQLGEG